MPESSDNDDLRVFRAKVRAAELKARSVGVAFHMPALSEITSEKLLAIKARVQADIDAAIRRHRLPVSVETLRGLRKVVLLLDCGHYEVFDFKSPPLKGAQFRCFRCGKGGD